jgi:hypothetical protein
MITIDISKGIKVGGFDYSVDMSEKAHRDLVADHDRGQCDLLNHSILIDHDSDPPQISKTFIHEVIEAVNYVYCNDKVEHEKIQQLSFGIHQVMESLDVRFGKL